MHGAFEGIFNFLGFLPGKRFEFQNLPSDKGTSSKPSYSMFGFKMFPPKKQTKSFTSSSTGRPFSGSMLDEFSDGYFSEVLLPAFF